MASVADINAARRRHAQLSVETTEHDHRYYVREVVMMPLNKVTDMSFQRSWGPPPGL
jgi:hypothetical protein